MNRTVDIPLSSLNDSDSELDEQPSIPKPEEQPIDPVSVLEKIMEESIELFCRRLNCNGFLGCGSMSNIRQRKPMKYVMQPERN